MSFDEELYIFPIIPDIHVIPCPLCKKSSYIRKSVVVFDTVDIVMCEESILCGLNWMFLGKDSALVN